MKYFEFKDFKYYALIGADSIDEAVDYYKDVIADIEDDGEICEISEALAKDKFFAKAFETELKGSEPFLILPLVN